MNKDDFFYFTWQCLLVLICGIVGLVGIFIKPALPRHISVVFAIIFIFCILTSLFFLLWVKYQRKQEEQENMIDSIGEPE